MNKNYEFYYTVHVRNLNNIYIMKPLRATICFATGMLPLHKNLLITYNNIGNGIA